MAKTVVTKKYFDDGRPPETIMVEPSSGPTIIDYDTSHLDAIEGHVSDFDDYPEAPQPLAVRNNNLVLPSQSHTVQRAPSGVGEMMATGTAFVQSLMASDPHGRIVQNDNAETHARASLLYSKAHITAIALIIAGVLLLVYPVIGGPIRLYAVIGLLVFGVAALVALIWNRRQGLWHSATGIAHHEISERGSVARYAIDKNHETFDKVLERHYGKGE